MEIDLMGMRGATPTDYWPGRKEDSVTPFVTDEETFAIKNGVGESRTRVREERRMCAMDNDSRIFLATESKRQAWRECQQHLRSHYTHTQGDLYQQNGKKKQNH